MTHIKAIGLALAIACPAAADITLSPPVQCRLGQDCYIQQYVDHIPGAGAQDFRCGPLTFNTHRGTDFAVPTRKAMDAGVNVVAAAPGRVTFTKDGIPDRYYEGRLGEVSGVRACGNAVLIDHGDGWSTRYCHLKQGSVRVKKGQSLKRGAVLGQVGLSGRAQFPHVHMSVRKDDKIVDPFDPDRQATCAAPATRTLWDRKIAYQAGGLLDVGFSPAVPAYRDVKTGTAGRTVLAADTPAIVVFGYAFGGRRGDRMRLQIDGPMGRLTDSLVTLDKNQAQFFRAHGKRRAGATWPKGTYVGSVEMFRDGRSMGVKKTRVTVK